MDRYIIGSTWDRNNRNGTNNNFEYLFESVRTLNDLSKKADDTIRRASYTLREAVDTNEKNKDVQEQLDQMVINSGTSDAEVIQARGEFSVLRERLDESDRKFKGAGKISVNRKGTHHQKDTKGTLVILDDDTRKESYDVLYQWSKANNVPVTYAANSSHIMDRDSNRINIEEFLEMKDDDLVEFVNHTHTHVRLTELNEFDIREEIRLCEEFLNSHGVYTNHLVYPFGAVNDDIKRIAADYVYSASKSSGRIVNPSDRILDSMHIHRIVFETEMSVFRSRISEAASVGGCVLINSHSQYETFDTDKLGQIVSEAEAAGLDVVHYSEAYRRFSNIMELRDENRELEGGISAGGYVDGFLKQHLDVISADDITMDSLPSEYPNNMITSTNIQSSKASEEGWPHPGRLFTSRSGPDDYTFQMLHPIFTNDIYKRAWDLSNNRWTEFMKVNEKGEKLRSTIGPYNIPAYGQQNITVFDDGVSVGDVVAYSTDETMGNSFHMDGPFIEKDGEIRFRLHNKSDVEREVPEFSIYTKNV